jgi:hypothetical protein
VKQRNIPLPYQTVTITDITITCWLEMDKEAYNNIAQPRKPTTQAVDNSTLDFDELKTMML